MIADDDRDLVDLLAFALSRGGFRVTQAFDAPSALRLMEELHPDLMVLDVNLGTWDGFDVLRDVRQHSQIPIIMLTARDAEEDKVRGLDLGADDYLTKPFSHRELIARIRAQLRRRGQETRNQDVRLEPIQVGDLVVNPRDHSVSIGSRPVGLSVTEFRLLHYLAANAGVAMPTRTILKHVWGYEDSSGTDLVRVTVHRIRRKLETDPSRPQLLWTVPGVGFMVRGTAAAPAV